MFVRWKKRPYTLNGEKGMTYSAYLVECKRIDGKPRQKNRGYLGSIREQDRRWRSGEKWPPGKEWVHGFSCRCTEQKGDLARAGFYVELRRRLKWLQLHEEQQLSIEQQIAKVVPHMTDEQCEASKQEDTKRTSAAYESYMRSRQA